MHSMAKHHTRRCMAGHQTCPLYEHGGLMSSYTHRPARSCTHAHEKRNGSVATLMPEHTGCTGQAWGMSQLSVTSFSGRQRHLRGRMKRHQKHTASELLPQIPPHLCPQLTLPRRPTLSHQRMMKVRMTSQRRSSKSHPQPNYSGSKNCPNVWLFCKD